MSDSATAWTAAHPVSLSFTISWSLLKFMSIESVMPSDHLILCQLLFLLPSIFLSIRVCSKELALQVAKILELQDQPSVNTQDWFPLGLTGLISLQSKKLSSLLQYHSSKASVLWPSAFFISILNQSAIVTWLFQTVITKREFRGNLFYWFPN